MTAIITSGNQSFKIIVERMKLNNNCLLEITTPENEVYMASPQNVLIVPTETTTNEEQQRCCRNHHIYCGDANITCFTRRLCMGNNDRLELSDAGIIRLAGNEL